MLTTLFLALPLQGALDFGQLDSLLGQVRSAQPQVVVELADSFLMPTGPDWQEQAVKYFENLDANGTLCLARVFALEEHPDGGKFLVAFLEDASPEFSAAALATLRLPAFDKNEDVLVGLGAWLVAHEISDNAELFANVAKSMFKIGDGVRRRAAKTTLRSALTAREKSAQAAAAIALAQCGSLEEPQVLEVLERLAEGFSKNASLAQSLIQQYEQQQRYRRKLEAFDNLLQQRESNNKIKDLGDLGVLEEVIRQIQHLHMEGEHYDRAALVAAAADGMLSIMDPHSNFLTGDEFAEFMFDMNPEYGGIGAYVNVVDGFFTITRPIYSGPAYEVGMLSGDRILEVDGWSTLDQPRDETIRRLKGKPGTEVKVLVYRRGWSEPKDLIIPRRQIDIPSLFTESLPGGILYLDLLSFSADCGVDIRRAVEIAKSEGVLNGVVLDLRGNPGGYLSEAVQICDVFLPEDQLVVTTRSRAGEVDRYETMDRAAVSEELPVCVLIDKYSAAASEIVSGALSVHKRALAIGERSHGKGSVQNLLRMNSLRDERWNDENRNGKVDPWEKYSDSNANGQHDFGPRIKLTLAYYFLPDGSTIHTIRDHEGRVTEAGGVQPDIEVDFPQLDIATLRELNRLVEVEAFRNFALDFHTENPALAAKLAEYDGAQPSNYLGFDEFFDGLDTDLEPNIARRWVRRRLRDVVADARGQMFAGSGFYGDFQEDPQLQAAIKQIFEQSGLSLADVVEYAEVFSTL